MADTRDMERRFSEYLERVLAGGAVPDAPDLDDEHRAALEFAAKMVQLRESPSPAFTNSLKARLLEKLAQREKAREKRGGLFSGAFWHQPGWQAASLVAAAIIVLIIVWRFGVFSPGLELQPTTTTTATMTTTATTTATPTTTVPQGWILSADVSTDKPVYYAGNTVEINVTLKNVSGAPVTLEKLPPILSLMELKTHQPVYTFAAGSLNTTLESGSTASFTYDWDQQDFEGQPVTGTYYISLEDLESDGVPVEIHLDRPVEFEILTY